MIDDATLIADAPAPPPPLQDDAPKPIANWLHTVALFATLALTTFYSHRHAGAKELGHSPKIPGYIASIALEWILLGIVIAGVRKRREFLAAAFRNRERTWMQSIGLGVMVYVLGLIALLAVGSAVYFTPLFHKRNEAVILAMAPHTGLEFLVWFGVSLTAGVCEELIFRGYLLQQLTAWTRSPIASIVIGAALFGSVHLYEGLGAILPLVALGLVYGLVVRHYKGDLRAVVVAHTLQDFVVALLLLSRPLLEQYQPKH